MKILSIILILGFSLTGHAQSLAAYQKIAAENNPGLQAQYKQFEASLQRIVQSSSLPDPQLSMGYFLVPIETRVGPQQARISLSQMFPWFGTLKAKEQVASLQAEAEYQKFLEFRNQLYYQVQAAFFPLYEQQRSLLFEKENQQLLQSLKALATLKFQNNEAALVDVLRVEMRLKDSQSRIEILIAEQKALASGFNRLLNRADSSSIEIPDSLNYPTIMLNYRRDSLFVNQPRLQELDLQIKGSAAAEKVARKQALPNIGLGLDYMFIDPSNNAISNSGQDAIMPMLSISLPIFRAKYQAAEAEAQLKQESYRLQKEELSNKLSSSYEQAWFKLQKQGDLMRLYRQQIQISKQSLELLYTAYSNSGKDFEELLRMQQQILEYQNKLSSAQAAYGVALAELDYLTAKSL
ncbi:TolC family protein [Croceimicrobium hydrocarbonivorans]|uniref:TolC family protein n=1 Tax=Croceimicrobium hydrocarbonivorans TaxID=2761580 RepID=A0A7H0VES1_9FLAO|nr:TolC family protein [Croceimicrobium hydrocarbonivorans]QNR24219.1 TolC family protein [Croceimicrobium hydrocarbonivorans]